MLNRPGFLCGYPHNLLKWHYVLICVTIHKDMFLYILSSSPLGYLSQILPHCYRFTFAGIMFISILYYMLCYYIFIVNPDIRKSMFLSWLFFLVAEINTPKIKEERFSLAHIL